MLGRLPVVERCPQPVPQHKTAWSAALRNCRGWLRASSRSRRRSASSVIWQADSLAEIFTASPEQKKRLKVHTRALKSALTWRCSARFGHGRAVRTLRQHRERMVLARQRRLPRHLKSQSRTRPLRPTPRPNQPYRESSPDTNRRAVESVKRGVSEKPEGSGYEMILFTVLVFLTNFGERDVPPATMYPLQR